MAIIQFSAQRLGYGEGDEAEERDGGYQRAADAEFLLPRGYVTPEGDANPETCKQCKKADSQDNPAVKERQAAIRA